MATTISRTGSDPPRTGSDPPKPPQDQNRSNEKLKKNKIQQLQDALDDLVSVNSFFTFAMFVGISFASSNVHSLELRSECQADTNTRMTLLVNEVVSFVCFLLSSLVTTALKMLLSTLLAVDRKKEEAPWNPCLRMLTNLMIPVSTLGSIFGCVYLTLSMVDVVRVLLGKLSCRQSDTIQAAASLIGINVLALAIYGPFMMLAIYQSYSNLQDLRKDGAQNWSERYEKLVEPVLVHQKPLDDLVSVNSLFTVAVFVGLAFANPGQQSIEGNKHCEAGNHVARRLVKNEVISFACYLLSSLVAKALKTHLLTYLINLPEVKDINDVTSKALRVSLFTLSTSASIVGGVFLLISMVDMIQLRLGKITCGGTETVHALGALLAVNILALVIYVPFVVFTIYKSTKIFDDL